MAGVKTYFVEMNLKGRLLLTFLQNQISLGCDMNRLFPTLAITVLTGGLLLSNPISAQFVPSSKKAAHVHILKGPELESPTESLTIIRWTSDNPWRFAGALWGRALRYGSQEPEPNREIAHPAEPDPFLY
jgi:hypothetical protein